MATGGRRRKESAGTRGEHGRPPVVARKGRSSQRTTAAMRQPGRGRSDPPRGLTRRASREYPADAAGAPPRRRRGSSRRSVSVEGAPGSGGSSPDE